MSEDLLPRVPVAHFESLVDAHRARCGAAMRLRAAADMVRTFLLVASASSTGGAWTADAGQSFKRLVQVFDSLLCLMRFLPSLLDHCSQTRHWFSFGQEL